LAKSRSADPPPSQVTDARSAEAADPPVDQPMAQNGAMPYPTIRSLPLLGAKYADYYRRAKIEETVFELLTQQYELAKVQEAKETPSVKVLDPGMVPEKKSFPPRLLIIFLGAMLASLISVVGVLASNMWQQADPDDPRKLLAQEVVEKMRERLPWTARNGHDAEYVERVGVGEAEQEEAFGQLDRRPPSSGAEER